MPETYQGNLISIIPTVYSSSKNSSSINMHDIVVERMVSASASGAISLQQHYTCHISFLFKALSEGRF